MSKSIQDWPLDGQIGAGLIVFSIVCLAFANFLNSQKDYVASADHNGFFVMKPLKSAYAIGLGIFCMACVITYAVLQSGKCINMTVEENAQNQLIGFVIVFLLWTATIYYGWALLSARYWFNRDVFIYKKFLQQQKEYKIRDVVSLLQKQGMLGFGFADGKKYYISTYHRGAAQLYLALDSQVLAAANPICLVPIEEKEEFLNKGIVVNILKPNADFTDAPSVLFKKGTITSIDNETIKVSFDDEEKLLAANMRGLNLFHGDGTGNTADYVGIWYVA